MSAVDVTALARALNDEGTEALETFVRTTLLPMVLADLPVGDPEQDPDPAVSLAERTTVERDGHTIRIVIDAEYASVQHYALYKHPRGGNARFLEDNLALVAPFIENVIGEAIRRRLAGPSPGR